MVASRFQDMVVDVAGPSFPASSSEVRYDDTPDETASRFYNLFTLSMEPAYDDCTTETEMSIHMKLLQTKTDFGLSKPAYDSICDTIRSLVGTESKIPTSYQQSKKLVNELGMSYIRIDVCARGCMIFYAECDALETACRFCGEARYKPCRWGDNKKRYKRKAYKSMFYLPMISRLQRLFMTESTASNMTLHASVRDDPLKMVHPSDGQSWKHFDRSYPDFAAEPHNVRLGLCSDGFSPFGMSSKSYSYWPVMITPYNLPPWMCMKTCYLWLTILIPGPSNPKKRIDMYLQPLMDDLLTLWHDGVHTYDVSTKTNFLMRAALMWTVSDYPAYGMLSGWSTQERLGCPYCMEGTKTFWLNMVVSIPISTAIDNFYPKVIHTVATQETLSKIGKSFLMAFASGRGTKCIRESRI